jgi:hypothetical protein
VPYTIEFDVPSPNVAQVSEVVSKALISAFGGLNNLIVTANKTYVAIFRVGQPIVWEEMRPT